MRKAGLKARSTLDLSESGRKLPQRQNQTEDELVGKRGSEELHFETGHMELSSSIAGDTSLHETRIQHGEK